MNRLKGKVAIITGAAGGQGASEAKIFAAEGAKVVLTDINEEGVKKIAAEIQAAGGEALALAHDISKEEDWKRVISETVKHFGALNVLVNNAGFYTTESLEETSLELWDKIHAVNSRSVFISTKLAVPEMRKAGGGSIINLSSVFGIIGAGRGGAYSSTKGLIRQFTKSSAMEFAKDRIRVNSIHPGVIETPMTKAIFADPEALKIRQNETPWPNLGKPEDIAYGALYLASDESGFVTGIELVIDGGFICH